MIGSDKPGYVIQAPFTGSFVQEVPRSSGNWRWPIGAGFYSGGPVAQMGSRFTMGISSSREQLLARGAGIAGSRLQARAIGGPVSAGSPYLVGDGGGAEIFTPGRSGTVHPAGSQVITQNITVVVQVPPTVNRGDVGREINESLAEFKRRGGRLVTP
jgi:hypothetical protein